MKTFSACPRCGNRNSGDEVHECTTCGAKSCKKCSPDQRFGDVCPNCKKAGKKVGVIGR
jgi:hypothetical protein